MSLVVRLDHKGEPTAVELDGRPIFVASMDIQYRPCEAAKVVIEMYVRDAADVIVRHEGEPVLESREFYAVSKADHELLMQLKKKDTL